MSEKERTRRANRTAGPSAILSRILASACQQGPGEMENLTFLKILLHPPTNVIFPDSSESSPLPVPWKEQPLPALPWNLIPFEVTVPLIGPSANAESGHSTSKPLSPSPTIVFPS